jgi:hypothetical protein
MTLWIGRLGFYSLEFHYLSSSAFNKKKVYTKTNDMMFKYIIVPFLKRLSSYLIIDEDYLFV